jgi:hypothetical protein
MLVLLVSSLLQVVMLVLLLMLNRITTSKFLKEKKTHFQKNSSHMI